MTQREPRWDVDFAYGRRAEPAIQRLLTWIATGNGKAEIKRKRYLDDSFYVETHCNYGRRGEYVPSGISTTRSVVWAYLIAETGCVVVFPVVHLRAMLTHPSTTDKAEDDGENPTRGRLINLRAMMQAFRSHYLGADRVAAARASTDNELDAEILRLDAARERRSQR